MNEKPGQSTSLRFKPLTEGLGLNHFADGLPYTPAHAKKKPTIQFNYPLAQAPIGTKSAQRMVEQFDNEARVAQSAQVSPEPEAAGSLRRVLAFGVDLALAMGLFVAIVWVAFTLNGFNLAHLLSEQRGLQIIGPLVLLYGVVHMGYFLIQETTWRRTLGKALFGIRISAQSGFATVGRAVCFLIAIAPLGLGLLWCFFDSRGRCWHDVITDSEVVLG